MSNILKLHNPNKHVQSISVDLESSCVSYVMPAQISICIVYYNACYCSVCTFTLEILVSLRRNRQGTTGRITELWYLATSSGRYVCLQVKEKA